MQHLSRSTEKDVQTVSISGLSVCVRFFFLSFHSYFQPQSHVTKSISVFFAYVQITLFLFVSLWLSLALDGLSPAHLI